MNLCVLLFSLLAHDGHEHASSPYFLRGDSTGDGVISIADALWTLKHLNHPNCSGYCADAGDYDASGDVTVSDAVATLSYLFMDRCPPASPFPECSQESTLGCNKEPVCR